MNTVERPWGNYKVLQFEETFQVKQLIIYPEKRLSLQSHRYRAEHWFIVSGNGIVQIDHKEFEISAGDSVDIGVETKHRISCTSNHPLIFIEVQTGSSFDENDIERFEDDFGRV